MVEKQRMLERNAKRSGLILNTRLLQSTETGRPAIRGSSYDYAQPWRTKASLADSDVTISSASSPVPWSHQSLPCCGFQQQLYMCFASFSQLMHDLSHHLSQILTHLQPAYLQCCHTWILKAKRHTAAADSRQAQAKAHGHAGEGHGTKACQPAQPAVRVLPISGSREAQSCCCTSTMHLLQHHSRSDLPACRHENQGMDPNVNLVHK